MASATHTRFSTRILQSWQHVTLQVFLLGQDLNNQAFKNGLSGEPQLEKINAKDTYTSDKGLTENTQRTLIIQQQEDQRTDSNVNKRP